MRYLSAEDILLIHARIIDATSGSHGVREIGQLASIVSSVQQQVFGQELYTGVFAKAAFYLRELALQHVFIDGNKRTSIATAARMLFLNGYELVVSNQLLESFTLNVLTAKPEIDTIAEWLKANSQKV